MNLRTPAKWLLNQHHRLGSVEVVEGKKPPPSRLSDGGLSTRIIGLWQNNTVSKQHPLLFCTFCLCHCQHVFLCFGCTHCARRAVSAVWRADVRTQQAVSGSFVCRQVLIKGEGGASGGIRVLSDASNKL